MATQLHIVTGKGGTGKTTVAAAMAMALAGKGKRFPNMSAILYSCKASLQIWISNTACFKPTTS